MTSLALAALIATTPPVPKELAGYLAEHQLGFTWKLASPNEVSFTSGYWQNQTWKHRLVIVHPPKEDPRHVAILMITGDKIDRTPDPDLEQARELAKRSHFPVVVLFDVPNQPFIIEDGTVSGRHDRALREDDLIAFSFQRYLETNDTTWPALFPMTRSALRAMDVATLATKNSKNPITKFVVTGESKRGWTTWMVGAAQDKRVIGIAPVAFDFLNFAAQLKRQVELWGKPSEMLASYTSQGLDQIVNSETGKRLVRLVDPYSYRATFKVPTLIVRGSNDPYWATDATRYYYDQLPQPHSLLILPNEGHDFNHKDTYLSTVAAFSRSCAGAFYWSIRRPNGPGLTERNARLIEIWTPDKGGLQLRTAKWSVWKTIRPTDRVEWLPEVVPPRQLFALYHWVVREHGIESSIAMSSEMALDR